MMANRSSGELPKTSGPVMSTRIDSTSDNRRETGTGAPVAGSPTYPPVVAS
jgi:hypothetical protein